MGNLENNLQFNNLSHADVDPSETADWLHALDSLTRVEGGKRARFILEALDRRAREIGIVAESLPYSPIAIRSN